MLLVGMLLVARGESAAPLFRLRPFSACNRHLFAVCSRSRLYTGNKQKNAKNAYQKYAVTMVNFSGSGGHLPVTLYYMYPIKCKNPLSLPSSPSLSIFARRHKRFGIFCRLIRQYLHTLPKKAHLVPHRMKQHLVRGLRRMAGTFPTSRRGPSHRHMMTMMAMMAMMMMMMMTMTSNSKPLVLAELAIRRLLARSR